MSLIVLPLAIINITIGVDEATLAVCLVISPETFIHGAIGPELNSLTLANLTAFEPLTLVLGPVLEVGEITRLAIPQCILELWVVVVDKVSKLLTDLLHVHALIVLAVSWAVHAWCENLVSKSLDLSLCQPHSKRRLEAYYDPDLLSRVRLSIDDLRWVLIAKLRLSIFLLTAAVISHLI